MPQRNWFVYILEADNGSLYTGITTDLERRLAEHTAGGQRGAKFFRTVTPVRFVYAEQHADRSSASQREAVIKKLQRRQKQDLIQKAAMRSE